MEENLRENALDNESCVAAALHSARETRTFVEVVVAIDREDTNTFLPGYVAEVDERSVLLQCVTSGGHYCGFLVKRLDRIYRVITGSLDARRAEKLFRMRGVYHDAVESCPDGNIPALLRYAQSAGKVVSIELIESNQWDIMGFVTNVDAQAITIRQVTKYGEDDGVCVVYLKDITEVSCDDDGEAAARLLHSQGLV